MDSGTGRQRATESSPLVSSHNEQEARRKKLMAAIVLVVGVLALAIGVLIGYFSAPTKNSNSPAPLPDNDKRMRLIEHLTKEYYSDEDDVSKVILKNVEPESIRKFTKHLSAEPHLEGTERNQNLSQYIHDLWVNQGLDRVELIPYTVLLSYPNETKPNLIYIINGGGNVTFNTTYIEPPLREEDENPNLVQAYHGLSPGGDIIGEPIYVNYGRPEDFDLLESLGINVTGKICLVKYGKIFRGNKVENAAERGAAGVIIFSDPAEVAMEGTEPEDVYPNTWWMPGTAMQRGSVYTSDGDPLTPGYPAVENAYRYPQKDANLPKIPSQPIGYDDALVILSQMSGEEAPKNWTGGLNITYRLGPGFNETDKRLRMVLNNKYRNVTLYNVIGIIHGDLEPDRLVIIGNHRDAWGFGALDAVSGTSPMLEVTRVLGELRKTGWRPRRTMVFCSWGGEEFGLMGSTEWVEEHVQKLTREAVAVINIDTCVKGQYFSPGASPSLMSVVREAAKKIPDPIEKGKSVYDTWSEKQHRNESRETYMNTLGSGTDHAPFAFYVGIPGIDLAWRYDSEKYPISSYPAYHTGYETFYLVDNITDPGFTIHRSCAHMIGILAHMLADTTFIPYNFVELSDRFNSSFAELAEKGILDTIERQNISIDPLREALENFAQAAHHWHEKRENITKQNPLIVRQVNDIMMAVERAFIIPGGLPNRPLIRHIAFAPSQYDQYSHVAFPGLSDLLYNIDKLKEDEAARRWQQVRRHLSDVMLLINTAAETLRPRTM